MRVCLMFDRGYCPSPFSFFPSFDCLPAGCEGEREREKDDHLIVLRFPLPSERLVASVSVTAAAAIPRKREREREASIAEDIILDAEILERGIIFHASICM